MDNMIDNYNKVVDFSESGNISEMERFLSDNPELVTSHVNAPMKRTALHLAVKEDNTLLVRSLLDKVSCPVSDLDSSGKSALHVAYMGRNIVTMCLVWEKATDKDKYDVLLLALRDGETGIASAMIRKAASLAFVKQNGLYLSHVAARYRRSSFIHTLLELDDKVMHLQDGWGNTLLHYAIESDLVTVADCLLKKSDWSLLASQRNKLGKNLQQYVLQMSKEMSAKIETILDVKISNSMSEQNFIGEIKKMFKTKEVEEAKELTEKQFKQDKPFLWFVIFISGVLFCCAGTRKIPGGYDSDWKPRLLHDKHFQWFLTYNTLAMSIYLVTTFICLSIMCLLGYRKTSKAYIKYASYPKFWKRVTLVATFLFLLASAFYMLTFAEGAAANKLDMAAYLMKIFIISVYPLLGVLFLV